MNSLEWSVTNTSTGESTGIAVGPHSTSKAFPGTGVTESPIYALIDGMMMGLVLYPQLTYHITMNGVVMIPEYDSMVQLEEPGPEASAYHKYRILISAKKFKGHYLADYLHQSRSNPRRKLTEAYVGFNHPEFLQGVLSLSQRVGVDIPWLALQEHDRANHRWVTAEASLFR